jgi:hypothetical protein
MYTRISTLVAVLALGVVAWATTPTIAISRDGEQFTITFEKGATWACTVYRMTTPTETPSESFPDGHYAPRHCWNLDVSMTTYPDDWAYIPPYHADWDVYAEIGYSKEGDIVYVSTNRVRTHR